MTSPPCSPMPRHGKRPCTDSSGFLVAAPLALSLGCGFVMVRKRGKLPGPTIPYTYELEYGSDTIEIQADAIKPGQRVIVLDDLLAAACIIELAFLRGRDRIDVPFTSVVSYDS